MTVTAITTDDDLELIIPPHNRKRMTPPDWTTWDLWHREAWTDILRHLACLGDPLAEADLTTPAEFKPAAVHHVAKQAYAYSGDHAKADYHRQEYVRILGHIKPTLVGSALSGTVSLNWGRTIETERG